MKIKYHTTKTYTQFEKPIEMDVETVEIVLCDGNSIIITQDQQNNTNIYAGHGTLVIRPDASNWIKIGVQRI